MGNIFFIFRIFQFFKFYKAKLSVAMSVVDRTTNIRKGFFPIQSNTWWLTFVPLLYIIIYIRSIYIIYICTENKEKIWIRMQPTRLTCAWLESHIHTYMYTYVYMRAWPRVRLRRVECWLLVGAAMIYTLIIILEITASIPWLTSNFWQSSYSYEEIRNFLHLIFAMSEYVCHLFDIYGVRTISPQKELL